MAVGHLRGVPRAGSRFPGDKARGTPKAPTSRGALLALAPQGDFHPGVCSFCSNSVSSRFVRGVSLNRNDGIGVDAAGSPAELA